MLFDKNIVLCNTRSSGKFESDLGAYKVFIQDTHECLARERGVKIN